MDKSTQQETSQITNDLIRILKCGSDIMPIEYNLHKMYGLDLLTSTHTRDHFQLPLYVITEFDKLHIPKQFYNEYDYTTPFLKIQKDLEEYPQYTTAITNLYKYYEELDENTIYSIIYCIFYKLSIHENSHDNNISIEYFIDNDPFAYINEHKTIIDNNMTYITLKLVSIIQQIPTLDKKEPIYYKLFDLIYDFYKSCDNLDLEKHKYLISNDDMSSSILYDIELIYSTGKYIPTKANISNIVSFTGILNNLDDMTDDLQKNNGLMDISSLLKHIEDSSNTNLIDFEKLQDEYGDNLPLDIVIKYNNEKWNWYKLTQHKHLTFNIISIMPDKNWNWKLISTFPKLTYPFVYIYEDKPWDWSVLESRDDIASEFINMNYPHILNYIQSLHTTNIDISENYNNEDISDTYDIKTPDNILNIIDNMIKRDNKYEIMLVRYYMGDADMVNYHNNTRKLYKIYKTYCLMKKMKLL